VLPFGTGAWIFICLYLLSLLFVGWLGRRARGQDTLKDFYLAGSGFGPYVLLMTLFATQYSGNTFYSNVGVTYRLGFTWLLSVQYMLSIIVFYRTFAIRLHLLSAERGYLSPTDFITDRFRMGALSAVVSVVMLVALNNYVLAQLMAIGRALQGLAGSQGEIAYNYGVVGLALIMVIYGTLGGMRAVAWTDVIQGTVLFAGFIVLVILVVDKYGSIALATQTIANAGETDLLAPPDAELVRMWFSYIFIVGIGAALYPQAMQRIFAARSVHILRKSFSIMALAPLVTALLAVFVGIYAIAYLPGLEGAATDQVLSRLFRVIQEDSMVGYMLVVLLFAAILSAMMSTADSALLTISSMFTKDIYKVYIRPQAPEEELTRVGKLCSWVLVFVLAAAAIVMKQDTSLISLIDRKFDLLVQLVPAIILGVRWPGLRGGPVLAGLLLGLTIALGLAFGPFDFVQGGRVWGIHPGLYGLAANLCVAIVGSYYPGSSAGDVNSMDTAERL
jgi:SSS family solute:Na+ symporter